MIQPVIQTLPDATTAVKGVALKGASISAGAAGTLIDSTGGSASSTLAAGITVGTVLSVAANVTDVVSLATWAKNAVASLAAQGNANQARLEEFIAKQQSAGQQA